jgi:cell division transport system permease protein
VAAYLTDPIRPDAVAALERKLQALPAVASVTYETKPEACQRFRQIFSSQPVFTENVSCDVIPASLRVHLRDTSLFDQITAALGCSTQQRPDGSTGMVCTAPGVDTVADYSDLLQRLSAISRVLSIGVASVSVVMLGSAIALIANTLRMGMFARRREIGIMRLVGATNWRIRVPFLIEGLVESMLGAAASILALYLVKLVFFDQLRYKIGFIPLIGDADVLHVAPWILIASAAVAIVAGTIGMRRFLDV